MPRISGPDITWLLAILSPVNAGPRFTGYRLRATPSRPHGECFEEEPCKRPQKWHTHVSSCGRRPCSTSLQSVSHATWLGSTTMIALLRPTLLYHSLCLMSDARSSVGRPTYAHRENARSSTRRRSLVLSTGVAQFCGILSCPFHVTLRIHIEYMSTEPLIERRRRGA
ncbi:hypothetical protein GY45DRAFT_133252 [Cubamyces sp. BRFM 1775]|nr:hypothetical protein GY45DRAFT_133252 [Cubamyces sp. BRFM 1775]